MNGCPHCGVGGDRAYRSNCDGGYEPDLPDGLYRLNGKIMFDCASCGVATELPVDPSEFAPGSRMNVCGGSPRCCP